jgi:hypothetical protein
VEGSATHASVLANPAPQIHDTAMLVPEWSVEGFAGFSVSRDVELGVRGYYAAYDWASPSAEGTMPLPSKPATWGVGPELRIAVPLDRESRFVLGIAGNLLRYETPYAEWTLTGPGSPNGVATPCSPSPTCVAGSTATGAYYQLYDERSESHLVYSFGVYPSMRVGGPGDSLGHVFLYFGGMNGFSNDGFTDTPTNGSTVSVTGPVWMVGAGYALVVDPVRLAGMAYKPLTDGSSPIDYGVGLQLTLGLAFDLSGPHEEHAASPEPAERED